MGFGSTAKKVQKMADLSQELYGRVNEMREQIVGVKDTVDATSERVDAVETELAEQRAIVEAIAEEQGVDVASVVADVEPDTDDSAAEAAEEPAADDAAADDDGADDATSEDGTGADGSASDSTDAATAEGSDD